MIISKYFSVLIWINPAWTESADATIYMKWASEKDFLVLKQWCSQTVFQLELGENTNQTLTDQKVGVIKETRVFPSSIRGTESHSDLTQTQRILEEKKNNQIKSS